MSNPAPPLRRDFLAALLKTRWVGAVALVTLAAMAPPASAQLGEVVETFGDWQIRCVAAEREGDPPRCAMYQFVVAEGREDANLVVLVWRDEAASVLRVVTPLEVRLRNNVILTIDTELVGRMEFERCGLDGCIAEVLLDERVLGLLRAGTTAFFGYQFDDAAEGIGFPIPLADFGTGYDALENIPPAGG